MKATAGYKKTEVGVIPSNWQIRALGELFDFRNGINADKESYGKGIPFVNVLEPITHSHLTGDEIPGRVTLPDSVSSEFEVRHGDVLFNRTSETQEEIGLAATYVGVDRLVYGGFVIRARPTSDLLDPAYSGYALRARTVRAQLIPRGQGAIRANIGQKDLRKVVAAVPPIAEQRAIARALLDADALLRGLAALLAKKRSVRGAAIQQLLSGNWAARKLGEVATFRTGPFGSALHKSDYTVDGVPVINPTHIVQGRLKPMANTSITESAARNLNEFRLHQGDVVMGRRGDMGRCAVVRSEHNGWLCGTGSIIIRPHTGLTPEFCQRVLSTARVIQAIENASVGSTMVNLNQNTLAELLIPVPSVKEQRELCATLSEMDREIDTVAARREKLARMRQGMLQQLLTGNIRLV